jgi:endoglucanase
VTNTTATSVTWTVVHRIEGRVTTSWNSERVGDGGDVVFRGAMWNRTLAPGERTELGFCASR